LINFFS